MIYWLALFIAHNKVSSEGHFLNTAMNIVVYESSNCLYTDPVRIFNKFLAKRTILICMYMSPAMKSWIGFLSLSPPPLIFPEGGKFHPHRTCGFYILVFLFEFDICANCGVLQSYLHTLFLTQLKDFIPFLFYHHIYTLVLCICTSIYVYEVSLWQIQGSYR